LKKPNEMTGASYPCGVLVRDERGTWALPPESDRRCRPARGPALGRPYVGQIKEIAKLFGGQGTINVNSWSPDSKQFAYVSYEVGKP